MLLRIGDIVLFGPPGKAKVKGVVVRRVGPKARIRQLEPGHDQPEGVEWNVPMTSDYIRVITPEFGGAARRGTIISVSKSGRQVPPRRSSRPPPPSPRRSSRPPPPVATAHRPGPAPPSGELLSHQETIEFAHELLRQWSVPNYKVDFSNRFTRRMGQCDFKHRVITLSAPLWPLATPEQRRQTAIHEVAHAVTRDRHGRVAAHGKEWKAQMRAMGAEPKRTHNVQRDSLRRMRSDTVAMVCCGAASFRVTLKKAHVLLTRGGRCRACHQPPVLASDADRQRYEAWVQGGLRIRPNSCRCGAHSLECGLVLR